MLRISRMLLGLTFGMPGAAAPDSAATRGAAPPSDTAADSSTKAAAARHERSTADPVDASSEDAEAAADVAGDKASRRTQVSGEAGKIERSSADAAAAARDRASTPQSTKPQSGTNSSDDNSAASTPASPGATGINAAAGANQVPSVADSDSDSTAATDGASAGDSEEGGDAGSEGWRSGHVGPPALFALLNDPAEALPPALRETAARVSAQWEELARSLKPAPLPLGLAILFARCAAPRLLSWHKDAPLPNTIRHAGLC